MKIVSLNTYHGILFEPLMEFVARHAPSTDVFCFQEVLSSNPPARRLSRKESRPDLLQQLTALLPDYDWHFAPIQDDLGRQSGDEGHWQYGLAMFVKKSLDVAGAGDFFICHGFNTYDHVDFMTIGSNAQYVQLRLNDSLLTVCNLHGASVPGDKLDTSDRLAQSEKLLEFFSRQERVVATGDFNLLPQTESIRMIERAGFRNLIAEYGIKTTRGTMMRKLHPEYELGEFGFQEFADYAFVSPKIRVSNFEVPDEPISDHLPLILEIEI